jgi:hypothetical protein
MRGGGRSRSMNRGEMLKGILNHARYLLRTTKVMPPFWREFFPDWERRCEAGQVTSTEVVHRSP